ncbi:calcium-binding protein [Tateyamaria omphalii]|uniref:calcium-binding protein n=1 Tax=Tateyamaria omphalii TaxID=299262 RepID=UPI001C99C42A|nr:calcium-binding protein [Tateyamaria omphalii]MBY5932318.1 calcium-binding protein [Tateyamaria omphalii]
MLFLLSLFPALLTSGLVTDDDVDEQTSFAEDEDGKLLIGTIGDDAITGGEGDDDIIGLLGNDTLDGGPGGNDVIQGLNGDDLLIGGEGNDAMQGRGDNDTVQGFSGDDWVDGNDGDDLVRGGGGSDVVIGGKGEDTVDGRSGDDVIVGGEFNADPLTTDELGILRDGGTINDIFTEETPPFAELRDDGAADQIFGGRGSDFMILGSGDVAAGGSEVDAFAVIADAADSELGPATISDFNSPDGESLALYFRADETVNEDAITVTDDGDDALVGYDGEVLARVTGAAGTLSAADIEILQPEDPSTTPVIDGTENADTLAGTAADEIINGLGANDQIEGGAGNDTIAGGDGSDIVQGQAGFDVITGNADDDLLQGRGGDDTLSGNRGFDWVDGNDGDDKVNGGLQGDTVIGGNGADLLSGGEGNDVVVGGELLSDPLSTTALEAIQGGATLNDALTGVEIGETLDILDDNQADTLDGGNGSDLLVAGTSDSATGGAGDDTFAILGAKDQVGAATILDYTDGEDQIIIVDTDGSETPEITVEADGDEARVFLNGTEVAVVVGAASTLTAADVTVTSALATELFDANL